MFQETESGWVTGYTRLYVQFKLYFLFLFVAIIVGVVRIVKLWIAAPPFRLARQRNNPSYLRLLEASCRSTMQWIGLVALGWALAVSQEIARFGIYADERTRTGWSLILSTIRDLGSLTELATSMLLFLFLLQWHMRNRMYYLRGPGTEKQPQTPQP